jgi:hypothetical protein
VTCTGDFSLKGGIDRMQQINFFCSECKKSLHISYDPEGAEDKAVMEGIGVKCSNCRRVIRFHAYTEGQLLRMARGNKVYV